ncbi:preprotein translocase subunit SecA [Actinocrispum wychmicini]|uniref:Protein translocase subunit SecA n=1 Tax=Actinocrispum wychmicini TaxID=1213861 RepID=A0A4V2S907_9PSEU|nr:preprotein translocase subunit SecA [Actinocrispum wychmicini]TCO65700.1 preprotein translocase SecA subunit [Actinocrispum wychmicini]
MVLARVLRAGEGKTLRRLRNIAAHINTLEDDVAALSDDALRERTQTFKERFANGETLDDLLPEAYATAREAAKRVLGQRHFDVQVMGGTALHLGMVAEMKTGEGKTLTCVLPAYLNAIAGRGVHVVTVNDYLVKRDANWMGRIHQFLGLNVGMILSDMSPDVRRSAYQADITYGTNNEFGFDYLRDNMAWSLEDCVQREHSFAIVDEVDSILIDEARTPLIISGPAEQSSRWYQEFARMAPLLRRDIHYEVDERKRTVGVVEAGVAFIEDQLGIDNLYESANTPLVGYLNNALKAKELYKKDKDYIVKQGEVLIVDEFTGRVLHGRRYNEGMHQAIEAKERVEIKAENQTLATITLQNYFRLYEKLAGMTGTAQTEAAELHQTYKLDVVPIPTNKPMVRTDHTDLIYKSEQAKYEAVAEDIAERHEKGQPVLVGTTSVERSEYLSKLLTKMRIPHEVLNAAKAAEAQEREAKIIAQAGQRGAVTIATNMAGRGTDIVLGGGEIELQQDPAIEDELEEAEAEIAGDPTHIQAHRIATEKAESKARDAAERQAKPIADAAQDEVLGRLGSAVREYLRTTDAVAEQRVLANRIGGGGKVDDEFFERRDRQYDLIGERVHEGVQVVLTKQHDLPADNVGEVASSAADRAQTAVKKATERSSKKDRGMDEGKRVEQLETTIGKEVYEAVHTPLLHDVFSRLRHDLFDQVVYDRTYDEEYEKASADRKVIASLGGLYVLGTERHESRRIDNQLRGRSGRQGDPGESRFYLSLGDELMRRFNAAMVERVMTTLRVPEDMPIDAKIVTRAIKSAQTQVEQQNFEIRKNVLKYDDVMNEQRKVIYAERRRMLEGEDISEQIRNMIVDVAKEYVLGATSEGYSEDWDHEKLWTALKTLYPVKLNWTELAEGDDDLTREYLEEAITEDILAAYEDRERQIDGQVGEGAMRELERKVVLSVLDRKWREHLYEMDYLKEGIGLRAMAQRDPLIEYQREGYEMFSAMLEALKEETVGFLFNLQVETAQPEPAQATAPTEVPEAFARAAEAARTQSNGTAQNGNGRGRHAAPEPEDEEPQQNVPPALRGKGLGGPSQQQRLNYSGPAEDGGVNSHDDTADDEGASGGGSGTRRERRAAARANAKKGRKGPRR